MKPKGTQSTKQAFFTLQYWPGDSFFVPQQHSMPSQQPKGPWLGPTLCPPETTSHHLPSLGEASSPGLRALPGNSGGFLFYMFTFYLR